jgi:hypothetical protein
MNSNNDFCPSRLVSLRIRFESGEKFKFPLAYHFEIMAYYMKTSGNKCILDNLGATAIVSHECET